jgi:hypothetical protein
MGDRYKPDKPSSYLIYVDANNLYGNALSNKLPTGDFKFLSREEMKTFTPQKIMQLKADDDEGYVFEVDISIPEDLHDKFDDFPVAPEKKKTCIADLSAYQIDTAEKLKIAKNTFNAEKLIADLNPKKHYKVHYNMLRTLLELGVKLDAIHRVVKFKQEAWLKEFIMWCTENRKKAKNDFEKDFYKLTVNSLFGRSIMQKRDRQNIRFVKNETQIRRLAKKATFQDFIPLNDSIGLVVMKKLTCYLSTPIYTGVTCLENARDWMIRFWYLYLKEMYEDRVKLNMTDTDSFLYYLKAEPGEDPYEDMLKDENKHFFDMSEFDSKDPMFGKFYNDENKKALGKFKVVNAADGAIEKSVFLKPKMYSYITSKNVLELKAKGLPTRYVKNNYTFQDYLDVLKKGIETSCTHTSIRTVRHQLYTAVTTKRGLNNFCGKRYLIDDENSLAYGNKRIKLM